MTGMLMPLWRNAATIIALAAAACSPIGPSSIRANRADYNMAIQQTNDQELLLNLVRTRYRDTLYFTTVERIAATQQMTKSISASAGASFLQNVPQVGGAPSAQLLNRVTGQSITAGPAVFSVSETPTVFYAPIEGQKFVQQMMTPMNPDTLALLIRSGWSLDRVFSVALQEMNGLRNAPTASGPTPSVEPEFKGFREAVKLLRMLQREQHLVLTRNVTDKTVEFRIIDNQASSPTALRLKELLQLNPKLDRFTLAVGSDRQNDHTIAIVTRPLMAALNYLSQGVDVPERDLLAGRVRPTTRADGKTPFDWQELLGGVFEVHDSPTQPQNASVAIDYRGTWFYIADDDLDAKSTFVLLTQLIALHSVPPPPNGPALSINVGG
jgi:hypothetical protein